MFGASKSGVIIPLNTNVLNLIQECEVVVSDSFAEAIEAGSEIDNWLTDTLDTVLNLTK